MSLFRVFLAHEAVTQFRSFRFRGLATVYVIAASLPAVLTWLISRRTPAPIGSAGYNALTLSLQPFLTLLLAAGLCVDGITRERDEGSFAVLSIAPISSAGYLLRRWFALVALCIPVTLLPAMIAASLAFYAQRRPPLLTAFAAGWLLRVLPALLAGSALAIGLGTITGRTVLAIIFGPLLVTAGIGVANDLLVRFHMNFSGPDQLFSGGRRELTQLTWFVRGYWRPYTPSEAAFPLRSEAAMLLPRVGITAAIAIAVLALSCLYMRRTRRDLRPWHIAETNPVRTLLRTANRVREEYSPDSGSGGFDRLLLLIGGALAAVVVGLLVQRQAAFAALGEERYQAETSPGIPTDPTVVAESMRIDATVDRSGRLRSRGALILRNSGPRAQSHLSFALNPGLAVRGLAVDRGSLRRRRVWQRLDVDLDPPLAPDETRRMAFDLDGVAGAIDFELQAPGNFAVRWRRYRDAKDSIYMTDLSRSTVNRAATEVRMALQTADLAPVPRYTPWRLNEGRDEGFIPEVISPPAALQIRLRHPYAIAADSCGNLARSAPLDGRCTTGLSSYAIYGGPFAVQAVTPATTLVYIPAQDAFARVHAPSIASSVRLALDSWPGIVLPSRFIFLERPREAGEWSWWYDDDPGWRTLRQLGTSGSLFLVPEEIFRRARRIDPGLLSAAIISGSLRGRRRIVPKESGLLNNIYATLALGRVGGRKSVAVESGTGAPPSTTPLLESGGYYQNENRLTKVLTAIEYRVGRDPMLQGINDFVAAGPKPGTARELLEVIGRRSGVDLSRAYADYFEGRALPVLTLADVSFRRSGPKWNITGAVINKGSGEAWVPLALRTSAGSLSRTLRVDAGERVPFTFSTEAEPRSLQLDPDRVCYRHAAIGAVETIDYRGGE